MPEHVYVAWFRVVPNRPLADISEMNASRAPPSPPPAIGHWIYTHTHPDTSILSYFQPIAGFFCWSSKRPQLISFRLSFLSCFLQFRLSLRIFSHAVFLQRFSAAFIFAFFDEFSLLFELSLRFFMPSLIHYVHASSASFSFHWQIIAFSDRYWAGFKTLRSIAPFVSAFVTPQLGLHFCIHLYQASSEYFSFIVFEMPPMLMGPV